MILLMMVTIVSNGNVLVRSSEIFFYFTFLENALRGHVLR